MLGIFNVLKEGKLGLNPIAIKQRNSRDTSCMIEYLKLIKYIHNFTKNIRCNGSIFYPFA